MKQTKRIFAVLIAVVLLLGIVPMGNIGITASATSKTADEAIAWVKSQEGKALDYDGKYGAQCVDLIMYYYNYLGVSISSGNGKDYATNALPSGWTRTKGGTPQKGDILVYSGSSSNTAGHVAIFESTSVLWHGRWDGVGKVQKTTSYKYNYSGFASPYWGCIHPNFSSSSDDVSVVTNKKHYSPNETAVWSFDAAGASSVHLYIYKDGDKCFEGQFPTSATYSRQMAETGHYAFYIVAHYPSGDINSAWNDCNVSVLSAYFPSGRNLFYIGETIDFSFSAPFASSVILYIYKNGSIFFEGQFSADATYSQTIDTVGHFTYYIVAQYPTGNETGIQKEFDVVLPSVETNKQLYQIGDTAEFSFNASNAICVYLYIYKDGSLFFEGQFSPNDTYRRILSDALNYAGNYYCYIVAHCDTGDFQSETYTFSVESDHIHSYTSSVTKAATCSAPGIRTYTCSCGDTYTEPVEIDLDNHVNTTNIAATPSTCTVKGYTAGVYCNDCEKYISGHQEQPLAAHTLTTVNQSAATCTAEGYTGDQFCTICQQTITTGTTIGKTAHTLTTINQRAATCMAEGYTGDQYCTTCQQTISTGTTIAKKAHTVTVINRRDATYDADGYTGDEYCTVCQQTIKSGTVIPKLEKPTDPTPSNPQPRGSCKWCGKDHGGAFGWLVKIIHNILAAILGARY